MVAEGLIMLADPRLVKLVLKEDDLVGFMLAYHDISRALQAMRGRLWPFGWLHILLERKRTEWVNANGIGVLPQYQGTGASILLYTEMAKTVKGMGFKHVDAVQVGADNFKSRSMAEAMGITWYKRHRKYARTLVEPDQE